MDHSVIGKPLPKVDAWAKVTGETKFADDLLLPRMAYAKVLRAQQPHARIARIDTSRANPEWYHGRVPNADGIPMGRQGTVDEIAATCLFLIGDDGGFITGQTIHVNGGAAFH